MPIEHCSKDGKPGFRYGASGACYPYTPGDKASMERARAKAEAQAAAVHANQGKSTNPKAVK